MANAFMNFYNKKFEPVLQNIPAQRDRSMQMARVQDGGIQDLGLCGECYGLTSARLCWIAIGWHRVGCRLWDTGQGAQNELCLAWKAILLQVY